ncbi:MAG TPA: hypothetical protein VJ810_32080 [Blastocatellia bacterium]|nr:hypothetical protein [Blastocatellia bacterium]
MYYDNSTSRVSDFFIVWTAVCEEGKAGGERDRKGEENKKEIFALFAPLSVFASLPAKAIMGWDNRSTFKTIKWGCKG